MIGVCIKYFHENYGGMLQAFATIKMLEEKNIEYELIQYENTKNIKMILKSIPRIFNYILLNDKREILKKKIGLKKYPTFAQNDAIRMEAFNKFKEKNFIKKSPIFKGYDELCKGSKRYDAVITGSDQLWSPAGLPTNYYNLMFVPDYIKKISFASSFGVSKIPWYQKRRTTIFLNRLDYISVRENRGKEIIKELTGKDVPIVLDPVFYFDKNGWEKLIPIEKNNDGKYIFAYFLGTNKKHREAVQYLSKKLNIKIIVLRHLDQYVEYDENFGDIALYDVGPDRFLNLIRNAEYICTDSFHGTCFSIIFEKKFMIFNRYSNNSKTSKNSRIDSLCYNLELNNRRFNKKVMSICDEINYVKVKQHLRELKDLTDNYLQKALY